jgi:methylated-DNA-[protein]-cysteine S-methyltransferase
MHIVYRVYKEYRGRRTDMRTRYAVVETVLGEMTLVASGDAVVGVYFRHHWYRPAQATFGRRIAAAEDPVLAEAAGQLDEYLRGDRNVFDLRTETHGDPFQERVWRLLRRIPRGKTITYGLLAERLGDKTQAQLVGQAVGRNPLSVIVPCHRVVGTNGRLTGYAGGLARKRYLLDLEEPAGIKAGRLF